MEYRYLCVKTVKDVEKHSPEKVTFDIIHEIGYQIVSNLKTLKNLEQDSPNGEVSVLVKYNTEGYKPDLTDPQRKKLSALAEIHKYLMDKMKKETGLENTLHYASLANAAMKLMEEIENKQE